MGHLGKSAPGKSAPSEITFKIERDKDSGWFVASWDDPKSGGITTQGKDLKELQEMILDAVLCYFEGRPHPNRVRLHFVSDPILIAA